MCYEVMRTSRLVGGGVGEGWGTWKTGGIGFSGVIKEA